VSLTIQQLEERKRLQLEAISLKINHQKIVNIIAAAKERSLTVCELETVRNLQQISADMGEV